MDEDRCSARRSYCATSISGRNRREMSRLVAMRQALLLLGTAVGTAAAAVAGAAAVRRGRMSWLGLWHARYRSRPLVMTTAAWPASSEGNILQQTACWNDPSASSDRNVTRLCRDEESARIIFEAWRSDESIASAVSDGAVFRTEKVAYGKGSQQHGQLTSMEGGKFDGSNVGPRPGLLLCHTAVGPQDLFLRWKAEALASLGYVVLTVDVLCDPVGYAWDPTWSAAARARVMANGRALLRERMLASFSCLQAVANVDAAHIGAVGFCFGGPCVFELARCNPAALRAIVSLHGILDGEPLAPGVAKMDARVLLCHGDDDPFVPAASIDACLTQLRSVGAEWQLLTFGGVRHSFTNPAQAVNPNPAFGYSAHAAASSWAATTLFLKEVFASL